MADKVRLGSIGLGWWGGELARRVAATGEAEVVRCFARSEDARRTFADEHGCTPSSSVEELLADPEIDGVLVATPHSTHLEMITAAAEAGKHVFVEKPLTLNVADARRAIEVTDAAGVTLQVGQHRRRQPANRALRRLIDAGELGQVSLIEANLSLGSYLRPKPGWRQNREESPLGSMAGLGVHMADNLIYLGGPAVRVATLSKPTLGNSVLDDVTVIAVELASGALGYLGTSHVVPKICVTAAYGSDGAAWSEEEGLRHFRQAIDQTTRTEHDVDGPDALVDQMTEFARCVRDGGTPEVDGHAGLEVVALYEAAIIAQRENRTVEVDELRG
jgi:predicted dehydrogenase